MALSRTTLNRNAPPTVGLVGVRDFRGKLYNNRSYVIRTFENHLQMHGIALSNMQVVTGGGRGVEGIIVDWCLDKGIECRKIPPNIADHGTRKAFTVRNNHIVTQSDELVMFWDGSITLLGDSITTAMQLSKLATVYPVI